MDPTTILVISPTTDLGRTLERSLPPERFAVAGVRPGAALLSVLRRLRPDIALVDRIDVRPEAAQLEIALLKELSPCTRIIALSGNSAEADAFVVEQGIFCYVAAPTEGELERLIHAAERAAETEAIREQ